MGCSFVALGNNRAADALFELNLPIFLVYDIQQKNFTVPFSVR